MAAGNVNVQIVETMTAAAITTAMDAAITATSAAARFSITQLNNKAIVIIAVEV